MAVLDSEEARGGLDVVGAVAEAQGPVVADPGLAPLVDPDTGVSAEVHPCVIYGSS